MSATAHPHRMERAPAPVVAAELPPELARWRAELAELKPEVVASLRDPILRLAAALPSLGGRRGRPDGDPDGFDGLTRRGDFNHVLVTEWLLADEAPDLFLQRAADGELARLARAFSGARHSQRSVVLFDTGPDQLGGPRLVHFAALFVLAARAAAAKVPFLWGLLQRPDEALSDAVGPETLVRLQAETALTMATAEHLEAWRTRLAPLVAADDLWLVGGPHLANLGELGARLECADAFEPGDQAVEVAVVHPACTARLRLEMPDDGRLVGLLRRPLGRAAAQRSVGRPLEPHEVEDSQALDLVVAQNGQRVFLRKVGEVVGHHLPPRAPGHPSEVGASRRRLLPPDLTVLGVGLAGRRVAVLVLRPPVGDGPAHAELYNDGDPVPDNAGRAAGEGSPLRVCPLPAHFKPARELQPLAARIEHPIHLRDAHGNGWVLRGRNEILPEDEVPLTPLSVPAVRVRLRGASGRSGELRIEVAVAPNRWVDAAPTSDPGCRAFVHDMVALCEVQPGVWHHLHLGRAPVLEADATAETVVRPNDDLPVPLELPSDAVVIGPLGSQLGLACLVAEGTVLMRVHSRDLPKQWRLQAPAVRAVAHPHGKAVACLLADGTVVALTGSLDRLQVLKNGRFQ